MSIKSQIGEIIESLIQSNAVDVDVYEVEVRSSDNYKCCDARAMIDVYGDLMVEVKIECEDIRELFEDVHILDCFTEEELKDYLGIEE